MIIATAGHGLTCLCSQYLYYVEDNALYIYYVLIHSCIQTMTQIMTFAVSNVYFQYDSLFLC